MGRGSMTRINQDGRTWVYVSFTMIFVSEYGVHLQQSVVSPHAATQLAARLSGDVGQHTMPLLTRE